MIQGYGIQGYGIAVNRENMDSFDNFFKLKGLYERLFIKDDSLSDLDKYSALKTLYLEDQSYFLEVSCYLFNEEVLGIKEYEVYGIECNIDHPKYFLLYFPKVQQGTTGTLTSNEIDKAVEEVAGLVFGMEDLEYQDKISHITNEGSMFGNIDLIITD